MYVIRITIIINIVKYLKLNTMKSTEEMNKGLDNLATFLGEQMEKLNRGMGGDLITQEIKKELKAIMLNENFNIEPYSGGDACIWVMNHKCTILGYDAVINGCIKFVVEKYDSNPCESIISESGYFEGYAYVGGEKEIFAETLLIEL